MAASIFDRRIAFQRNAKIEAPLGWVAVSHRLVEAKEERRALHGKLVRISSHFNGDTPVYRALRFHPAMETSDIVIDWVGWIDLQGRDGEEVPLLDLEIHRAGFWHQWRSACQHPDPGTRLANRVSVTSLALGVLGALLGVLSLALSCVAKHQ